MHEFKEAIKAAGLIPPDHIPTGKIIAFAGLGKPKSNKAARCLLFPDRQGGWFMDFSTSLFEVWQAKRDKPYSESERKAFKQQCERDRLAREHTLIQTQQQTATKARKIWQRAILAV